jgi:hypothetical protein
LTPSHYKSEQAYLESLARSFRDAVLTGSSGGYVKRGLSPQWPSIRDTIESELAALETKVAKLKPQYAEAIATAEGPLSFYA